MSLLAPAIGALGGRAMKIGVIGSGVVGQVLADGFLKKGHEVMRGTRDVAKLVAWKGGAGSRGSVGSMAEAARFGSLVVLAVKGGAAVEAVGACGEALDGKVVIDTTNPIAEAPPVNGVLQFFTGPSDSLMERLQKRAPAARFVKAFSCVGNALMVDPKLPGGRPTMFICGNDEAARKQVAGILDAFGWDVEDAGAAEAARAIEPLCMLWCIPGFRQNRWMHAFKLLRA
jgi:predicted dinucleotide-binding enzyme